MRFLTCHLRKCRSRELRTGRTPQTSRGGMLIAMQSRPCEVGGRLERLDPRFDDPEKDLSFQAVFRLAAAGELTAPITDLRLPNGIGLSPDEQTLYVSNSQRSRPVWMAYTLDATGRVVGERVSAG
jgi:hypothetical protein